MPSKSSMSANSPKSLKSSIPLARGTPGLVGAGLSVLAVVCPAQAQHDIDVVLRASGMPSRIETGAVLEAGGPLVFPVYVYPGAFEPGTGFTDEPGFDTAPGAFPPGTVIGFDIRDALRKWDGTDFHTIPPERIEIRFGFLGPVTTPLMPGTVPGLSASVSAGGEYHKHYGFTLTSPASQGVYLLNLSMWSDSPTLGTSDPFWIAFLQGEGVQEFEEALAWATANLPAAALCRPDLTATAIAGQPGYGVPNGTLNNDDFFYYLAQFAAGNLAVADLTTTAIAGSPGYGVPNGVLNNDDFFYYLALYAAGC